MSSTLTRFLRYVQVDTQPQLDFDEQLGTRKPFDLAAMLAAGVLSLTVPIRGGTDGTLRTYTGLPTPNLIAGGHNLHRMFELSRLNRWRRLYRSSCTVCGASAERRVCAKRGAHGFTKPTTRRTT